MARRIGELIALWALIDAFKNRDKYKLPRWQRQFLDMFWNIEWKVIVIDDYTSSGEPHRTSNRAMMNHYLLGDLPL